MIAKAKFARICPHFGSAHTHRLEGPVLWDKSHVRHLASRSSRLKPVQPDHRNQAKTYSGRLLGTFIELRYDLCIQPELICHVELVNKYQKDVLTPNKMWLAHVGPSHRHLLTCNVALFRVSSVQHMTNHIRRLNYQGNP